MDNACQKWCSKCSSPACKQANKRRRHCLSSSVNGIFTDVTMMSSLCTALLSKQEKYLIIHLRAWSIAMKHAKNYEIRCKIVWNIRIKRVEPFSGYCNLRFLSIKVLQGSVATRVNNGRIFIDFFTANLPQKKVKEFWKSVSISQSYRQK